MLHPEDLQYTCKARSLHLGSDGRSVCLCGWVGEFEGKFSNYVIVLV